MNARQIDAELMLVPYFEYPAALSWYLDPDVCKQSDNIDFLYDAERLHAMYAFLSSHGDCFYISYMGELCGDVTLRENGEICIVVAKPFQNKHIGRRCVAEMLRLAKEKGLNEVKAVIYSFNTQSQRMFLSAGFERIGEEEYVYRLKSE